jgi:polysaccharide biosynthesis transport protein
MDNASNSRHNLSLGAKGPEQLISATDVFKIIRHHWKFGAFCGLIVAFIAMVSLLFMPPLYRAHSSILIELSTENIMDVREVMDSGVQNSNLLVSFMNTHIERLKSRAIAEKVFDALNPKTQSAFYTGYIGPLEEYDKELPDASSLLVKHALQVTWETESQAIQIQISHRDPAVAQVVANTYVQVYMRYRASLREQSTSGAVTFLNEQLKDIRQKLEASEKDLQHFRVKHSLVSLGEGEGIISQKLAQINKAVTDSRIRLLSVQSRISQIEAVGDDLEKLMSISFVGGREEVKAIYAQLQELRREYKVLYGVYLGRHPLIVENLASQGSVLDALWTAIDQARNEVAVDYKTTEGELDSLVERLVATERDSLAMEGRLTEYRVLERNVEVLRNTYDMLSIRYTQMNIAQRMNLNNVRVLDTATKPTRPVWPDEKKIAMASILLGGIFFLAVPLAIEFFDSRVKTFSDIEHYAATQLLGDIHDYPNKSEESLGKAIINQDEDLREPFRAIYGGLRLKLDFNQKPISLIVTSSEPGEGKSFVAANLAATFASHKLRVLLVDCDLRRATLHRFYGLENSSGMLQWVTESHAVLAPGESPASFPELDIRQVAPNLSLLSSGGSSEHATEILGDTRFKNLMEAIKASYEVIIFDTPPAGLFPDATLVADYASATLFVARQLQVTRQKVRYTVNLMGRSSAPVIGAVFNGIKDIGSVVGYGDFEGSYYGYGYNRDTTRYQAYYREKSS